MTVERGRGAHVRYFGNPSISRLCLGMRDAREPTTGGAAISLIGRMDAELVYALDAGRQWGSGAETRKERG